MAKNFIVLFFILCILSCSKKSNKYIIDDFSKPVYDTLVPYENPIMPYGVAIFRIEGHVNDTVSIKFWGIEREYINEFSDEWNMDVQFEFYPLDATEGEIKVECSIQ